MISRRTFSSVLGGRPLAMGLSPGTAVAAPAAPAARGATSGAAADASKAAAYLGGALARGIEP
ncbi:hypothetical protein ABZ826_29420 [Streptomyces sp. NPDC047515]|uniref:hypothetical protein n=1 Tax=Streptomyces sp. NPDC047515 TaxID=3155380 RepID=UPI0034039AE4